jgi:hypothetical protein
MLNNSSFCDTSLACFKQCLRYFRDIHWSFVLPFSFTLCGVFLYLYNFVILHEWSPYPTHQTHRVFADCFIHFKIVIFIVFRLTIWFVLILSHFKISSTSNISIFWFLIFRNNLINNRVRVIDKRQICINCFLSLISILWNCEGPLEV